MISKEKRLWFMISLCFRTTDEELAEAIANEIVKRIETEEEFKFVEELVEQLLARGKCNGIREYRVERN